MLRHSDKDLGHSRRYLRENINKYVQCISRGIRVITIITTDKFLGAYSLVSHSVPEYPETHSHTLGKLGSGTRQIPRPLHALAGHTLRSETKSIDLMND